VIPGTNNGNLTVTDPTGSILADQPFDVTLAWNEPQLEVGDAWFALVEYGSDGRHPNNAGSMLVKIARPTSRDNGTRVPCPLPRSAGPRTRGGAGG
jgi:hypothetical protein